MEPAEFTPLPKPVIDGSAFIAPQTVVVGDVTIGPDASIWYGAILRGDCDAIRVGARTNIQDGCVLHADPGVPCVLGEGVTVGHRAIVHGARVGNNALIGMGAIVMNGAQIGENALVGVGAVVTEGTCVPPGTLFLGVPARYRRDLTPEEIEHNSLAAAHYVAAGKRFRAAQLPCQK